MDSVKCWMQLPVLEAVVKVCDRSEEWAVYLQVKLGSVAWLQEDTGAVQARR